MSREVIVVKHCDICKTKPADESIEDLTFDGMAYETDLCAEHADALRAALAPYLDAAFNKKPIKARRPAAAAAAPTRRRDWKADRAENAKIRAWARDKGHDVGSAGQIPVAIRQAYWDEQILKAKAAVKTSAPQPEPPTKPAPAKRATRFDQEAHQRKLADIAKSLSVPDPQERAAMRRWAADQGRKLGHGLIPRDVQEGYRASLNGAAV